MRKSLFIGVDGGGTRCSARLRDGSGRSPGTLGNMLGEGTAGPGNARLRDAAFREVMEACRAAFAAAELGEADFARTHAGFGLAGTQQPEDRQSVYDWPHPFASLVVDTDAWASLMGAFKGHDGAIFIAGTGSAGVALVNGKRHNVGGWGADIGDEGSGMAIGRTAIRKSLWAHEGMAPLSPLAKEILARFHNSPPEAVMWAGTAIPGDFAKFAPMVFDHAERRDVLATEIIHEAALDIERSLTRLLDLGAPKIAMIGGVFPRILEWLAPPIREHLGQPEWDAMDGAILMAEHSVAERETA